MVNKSQFSTAMLGAVTVNMNKAEGSEPISHSAFLPYPAADIDLLDEISEQDLAITAEIVPSPKLMGILMGMREQIVASYYWEKGLFLYV